MRYILKKRFRLIFVTIIFLSIFISMVQAAAPYYILTGNGYVSTFAEFTWSTKYEDALTYAYNDWVASPTKCWMRGTTDTSIQNYVYDEADPDTTKMAEVTHLTKQFLWWGWTTKFKIACNPTSLDRPYIDINNQSAALIHEFGHVFNLGDNPNNEGWQTFNDSIMNYRALEDDLHHLQQNDFDGVNATYGNP